jgi:hypothetical protein
VLEFRMGCELERASNFGWESCGYVMEVLIDGCMLIFCGFAGYDTVAPHSHPALP